MSKVLIIGAGGVGRVVTHKCAQHPEIFSEICLASRTVSKCDVIASEVARPIRTAAVDADNVDELVLLINDFQPDVLIHVALPYQDLSIMEACLRTGTPYLDTANYEPLDDPRFSYSYQWKLHDRFKQKNLMALLGSGFDPGVTQVFSAYALKHDFDQIETIDILDCNAGSHGHPFATNFNPEINIREITQRGKYFEDGEWKTTEPLSVHFPFDYPGIGEKESYLLYHEELESLAVNIPGVRRIRFFMTFGQEYLTHLRVLQNVGMTSIKPVVYEGKEIVPLKFLQAVLPDPAKLGTNYTGKTNIGCIFNGTKDGKKKQIYIYNICDHAEAYKETNAQAISYTTGVPAMIGASLMVEKIWNRAGVYNVEQFDPDPFMDRLNKWGLPWVRVELPAEKNYFEAIDKELGSSK